MTPEQQAAQRDGWREVPVPGKRTQVRAEPTFDWWRRMGILPTPDETPTQVRVLHAFFYRRPYSLGPDGTLWFDLSLDSFGAAAAGANLTFPRHVAERLAGDGKVILI